MSIITAKKVPKKVQSVVSGDEVYFEDPTRDDILLAVATTTMGVGRNSNNTTKQYLRGPGGVPTNLSGFILPYNATLVGLSMVGYKNDQTWTLEIRKNGSTTIITSLSILNAYTNFDYTLNINFFEGDQVQMYMNGVQISYPTGEAFFKRRLI